MSLQIRPARLDEVALAVEIDDESGTLFVDFGLPFELGADHPFVLAEHSRWERGAREQRLLLALGPGDDAIGFAALDRVDGLPYVDQLSTSSDCRRRSSGWRCG